MRHCDRVVRARSNAHADVLHCIQLNGGQQTFGHLPSTQLPEPCASPRPHSPVARERDAVAFAAGDLREELASQRASAAGLWGRACMHGIGSGRGSGVSSGGDGGAEPI